MYNKHISKIVGVLVSAFSMMAMAAAPTPGLTITAANADAYMEYLPESMLQRAKEGEEIKVFATTPWQEIMMPEWRELTEKNRGRARLLDAAGTLGDEAGNPWPGGVPFPDPQSALEVMVNFQYHIEADEWNTDPLMRPMTRLELFRDGKPIKQQIAILTRRRMTSRAFGEPLGAQPGYENELERTATYFLSPYDVKGLALLNIIYRDQNVLPDAYAYVPILRRVRRLPTNQRADSQGGTDLTIGDVNGFSDPIGLWDFKILARKPMLATMTRAPDPLAPPAEIPLKAGRFISPYASAELRDTFVIEATPKYNTVYSKKILYLDANTFRPTVSDFYDNQGKLLKAYHVYWSWDGWPNPRWIFIHNLQTRSLTVAHQFNIAPNTEGPLKLWLESSLSEFAR